MAEPNQSEVPERGSSGHGPAYESGIVLHGEPTVVVQIAGGGDLHPLEDLAIPWFFFVMDGVVRAGCSLNASASSDSTALRSAEEVAQFPPDNDIPIPMPGMRVVTPNEAQWKDAVLQQLRIETQIAWVRKAAMIPMAAVAARFKLEMNPKAWRPGVGSWDGKTGIWPQAMVIDHGDSLPDCDVAAHVAKSIPPGKSALLVCNAYAVINSDQKSLALRCVESLRQLEDRFIAFRNLHVEMRSDAEKLWKEHPNELPSPEAAYDVVCDHNLKTLQYAIDCRIMYQTGFLSASLAAELERETLEKGRKERARKAREAKTKRENSGASNIIAEVADKKTEAQKLGIKLSDAQACDAIARDRGEETPTVQKRLLRAKKQQRKAPRPNPRKVKPA
jgi:hypothetical protein